jgi:hypothetical protein
MKLRHLILSGKCVIAHFFGHFLLDYKINLTKGNEIKAPLI